MRTFKVRIYNAGEFIDFHRDWSKQSGFHLFRISPSGMPYAFALGYCSWAHRIIAVVKLFRWQLRLLHEVGHAYGEKDIQLRGHYMHFSELGRGKRGLEELREKILFDETERFWPADRKLILNLLEQEINK